ncbi:MAG: hypothetical protein US50_C0005G0014 [Candidatus Nomurabacteria bacterium GW2011_GWB1_37_5]|uniref:Uncharacterized protein n=1 Tax=Candidatus Nomurabacteria bacterium GW2011_GWB1_37_5 TaxID=1618742 RepID=A0A0G0GXS8_9BACT|nr:MAG: hypothetical protein US50_C0005G0014 [Candidatus Nomurabacteria bacterium GW2011_GWB1_37_5]
MKSRWMRPQGSRNQDFAEILTKAVARRPESVFLENLGLDVKSIVKPEVL